MELKLGGKYTIGKELGAGAFGKVYHATEIATKAEYAIKVESTKNKNPQLLHEAKLIKTMKGKGIPELKAIFVEGESNIMVMTLLGKSLEALLKVWKGKFSLHTVLMIAIQALERIEHIQTNNFFT